MAKTVLTAGRERLITPGYVLLAGDLFKEILPLNHANR